MHLYVRAAVVSQAGKLAQTQPGCRLSRLPATGRGTAQMHAQYMVFRTYIVYAYVPQQMTEGQVRAIDFAARCYDYGRGPSHARKVADIAASVFGQLQHLGLLPDCPPSARNVLFAAALAHDVGMSERARADAGILPSWAATSGYDVSRVAGFQVLKALLDNPPPPLQQAELSREDRCGLLYLVLWDDNSPPREVPGEPLLCGDKLRLLAGTLRVADCLDFHCNSLVSKVRVLSAESSVRFIVHSMGKVAEEVACAASNSALLASGLGRRLGVQEGISTQEPGAMSAAPQD